MRQFVSPRFWLAIAALVGLTYGLWYVLVRKDDSVAVIGQPAEAGAGRASGQPGAARVRHPGRSRLRHGRRGSHRRHAAGTRRNTHDGGEGRHARADHLQQARRDQPVHRRRRSARRRGGVVLADPESATRHRCCCRVSPRSAATTGSCWPTAGRSPATRPSNATATRPVSTTSSVSSAAASARRRSASSSRRSPR